jgi:hypothetical protein
MSTMSNGMSESMEIRQSNPASPEQDQKEGAEPPSGFILKLYQMVNGAPNEVISVSLSRSLSLY